MITQKKIPVKNVNLGTETNRLDKLNALFYQELIRHRSVPEKETLLTNSVQNSIYYSIYIFSFDSLYTHLYIFDKNKYKIFWFRVAKTSKMLYDHLETFIVKCNLTKIA